MTFVIQLIQATDHNVSIHFNCLLRGSQCTSASNCASCSSLDLSQQQLKIFPNITQCNTANGDGELDHLNVSNNLLTEMPDQAWWLNKNDFRALTRALRARFGTKIDEH